MTDNVRPIAGPKPVKSLPENDIARRVMLQQTASAMVEHEPAWAQSDEMRLALLVERIGDVAAAFNRGHTCIEDQVLHVLVTAQAWLEARGRDAAA